MRKKNVISLFLSALLVGSGVTTSAAVDTKVNSSFPMPNNFHSETTDIKTERFVTPNGVEANIQLARLYAEERLATVGATRYDVVPGAPKKKSPQVYIITYYA